MAEKYLKQSNGVLQEQEATVVSTGASDAGKIPALDNTGKLDNSLLPPGVGAETKVVPASEDLAAGDFVNFFDDGGTLKVRKADASVSGKYADGFVLAAVNAGSNATVYLPGQINNQLTGLSAGSYYYLSASSPGGITATPPSSSGQVVQKVGKAVSETEIVFSPSDPIILA